MALGSIPIFLLSSFIEFSTGLHIELQDDTASIKLILCIYEDMRKLIRRVPICRSFLDVTVAIIMNTLY